MIVKTKIELDLSVNADYWRGRPAPACQDHDSPRYSDPGDGEEIEILDVKFIVGDDRFPVPEKLMGYVCDTIVDDVMEKCHAQSVSDVVAAMHDIRALAGYRR